MDSPSQEPQNYRPATRQPLHTFTTIKTHLLRALTETGLKDLDNKDVPLPASPSEIQFGRAVNILDPNAGFTLGEWEQQEVVAEEDDGLEEETGKKKGKGRPPKKDVEEGR
ncbi:hypothetical protein BCR34DRAFT_604214 [Clohesyomyces aquaticus]|uniref:Uncharacterized protein n=1 Tax=Clohesyomyces aquaticus TaxID=1231657 RepID=A0A1Y1Z824_9PLEO|nr:hypothetical protein BCR34DRAFT_604214 [Clohesyomyces aquaticus]